MAVYTNDLRLTELATGEGSGTWGTTTNTNLSLIADSFGFGTEAITTNADTHTTTIADGSADAGRAIFLKYTGTLDSTCTITIGPNTVSKLWFIENATSGSQSIIIKQGSGATVTIANGQTKAIYSDGAGSGGAMIDALQDLSIPDLFIDDDLTIGDDLVFSSDSAVITFGADGDTTLTHTDGSGLTLNSTNKIMFNDASQFIQGSSATVLSLGATDEIDLTATAIDVNGTMDVSGELTGSTASFSSSSDSDVQLTLTNTGVSSSHAPTLDMHRNSASPADDDQLGRIRFRGENDASENITYASISVLAADVTDGTEDGTFRITTKQNGADKQRVSIKSAETVLNEQSADIDFRVESDSSTHMLFVEAGTDRVGINNNSPSTVLHISDTSPVVTLTDTDTSARNILSGASSNGSLLLGADEDNAVSNSIVSLRVDGSEKAQANSTGFDVTGVITTDGLTTSADLTLDAGAELLTSTAGSDNIRIGEAAGDAIASGGTSNIVIGKNAGGAITTGDANIAIGVGALKTEDTGNRSIAIGSEALANQDRDGFNYNIAIGFLAANDVTSGIKNIIVGGLAGDAITTGQENTAIGHVSLSTEVAGNYSVAVGKGTLENQTFATSTDAYNVAVGQDAGNDITSGIQNTLVGGIAGDALTDADNNVAMGYAALTSDTLGSKSVAIGKSALQDQNFTTATDSHNTAVGSNAGMSVTTGIQNTLVGSLAGDALTDADNNVALGHTALGADTLGSRGVAVGAGALGSQNFTTATNHYNVAIGYNAGNDITTGINNTLVGGFAGDNLTVAEQNTAVGYGALNTDTLGERTVAIGYLALSTQNFTTATNANNIAIGWEAGRNVTNGQNNVLIGTQAGHDIVGGDNNVAVGNLALDAETEGQNSTAIGRAALGSQNFTTATNTNNVAVGYNAGVSVTTGKDNTLIGGLAADVMTTGDGNTFVGKASAGAGDVTGNNNTALGIASGQQLTSGGNNLLLGHDAGISGSPGGQIDTESNTIVLGDENISSFNCQVALTVASDERDKTDFVDLDLGLEFVKALEPVTYYWDRRSSYGDKEAEDYDLTAQTPDGTHKEEWMDVGFKAQSVQALEEAAGYSVADKSNLTVSLSSDGNQYGLRYEKFVPILVKAIQEQDAIIASLTARIAALEL